LLNNYDREGICNLTSSPNHTHSFIFSTFPYVSSGRHTSVYMLVTMCAALALPMGIGNLKHIQPECTISFRTLRSGYRKEENIPHTLQIFHSKFNCYAILENIEQEKDGKGKSLNNTARPPIADCRTA
jgi:hypothetical protein